jgi:dUTP pyrophosphatase
MSLTLRIKRLDADVPLPRYEYLGDAACDLFARESVTIAPGERVQVPTGIAMEIPDGYVGFIWDKSGLSHKHGLKTLGGVIDAGYRGEVMVGMVNLGDESYTIEKHHKVAQLALQKVENVSIDEVDELSDAVRGDKGFGSSGK